MSEALAQLNDDGRLREAFARMKRAKLLISLALDAIGMLTYLFPVSEGADLVWAPIAAAANFFLNRGAIGLAGGALTFAEELVPFADAVPSVTITWFVNYVLKEEQAFLKFVRDSR